MVFHPLDLVKVRFQVVRTGAVPSIWTKMVEIVAREGPLRLFAGLTPSLVASAASWGGFFYFYERAKTALDEVGLITSSKARDAAATARAHNCARFPQEMISNRTSMIRDYYCARAQY